jgi:hypothetical protein
MCSNLKSIIISGNLNVKNSLTYKLCPNNTEFSQGIWNISIPSISYSCEDQNVKEICQFSCNFVKSRRWSKGQIESYEQPFGMFLLESTSKTIAFEKTWFLMNADSNELIINVKNLNENYLNLNCFVSVLLLFKKLY